MILTYMILTLEALLAFIDSLRRDGYNIGTEQYIAAQDLLLALAANGHWPHSARRLKTLLAPILCTSPKEQEDFYQRFGQWLTHVAPVDQRGELSEQLQQQWQEKQESSSAEDDLQNFARRTRPWRWIVATFAVMLLAAIIAIIFTSSRAPVLQTLRGKVVAPDGTALEDVTISFLGRKDTTDANGHFSFQHPVKDSTAHLLINHPPYPPKQHPAILHRRDTSRVVIKLDQPITIPSLPQDTLKPSLSSAASEEEKRRQQLEGLVAHINAFADQVENEQAGGFYRRYYSALRFGALLLPLLLFTVWWSWQRYRRRLLLEKRRTAATPELQRIVVKGASEELFRGPRFRRAAQQLRRHREIGSSELDAAATVATTIEKGGWFSPVYGRRQVLPEYLVLVDRASFHDQQARRVDEIVARLQEDGVFVDRYYFDADPRICRSADPQAPHLALEELAMRYPEHRLMIFSDGAGLMHPLTGRPQRWLEMFFPWLDRALLTPETPNHWGYREMALSGLDFVIMPATPAGLAVLVETMQADNTPTRHRRNGAAPFPEMLHERPKRYLERHEPEPEVVDELGAQLRDYLGEAGYDWLCACAVYPMLAWDLTLYLGSRLTDAKGEKLLEEERLVALARLPWLKHGSIPDWLRLRLLADLSREQERAIRQALEDLLQSALAPTRDGFVLDIARPIGVLNPRDLKRLIQDLFRTASDDHELRDYVFLTFMSGRKPRKLAVTVPNLLRRFFFRRGQAILGMRPATALGLAAVAALSGWKIISAHPPVTPPLLVIPRFQVVKDSSAVDDLALQLQQQADPQSRANIGKLASSRAPTPRPAIARSDSAWSYYAKTFAQQNQASLPALHQRYRLAPPADSLSPLAVVLAHHQLYLLWLTDTLDHAIAWDSLSFALCAPTSPDSAQDLPLQLLLDKRQQMLDIPRGTFLMGSNDSGYDDEKPEHRVTIDGFKMDKYEVTVAQYQRFITATNYRLPRDWEEQIQNSHHPVVNVSWEDATAYAQWAGKRLPTEAQWEYAARGGYTGLEGNPKYQFPWGNEASHDQANYWLTAGRDQWEKTSPVGSFPPNGYGLYDMTGNVWEWCADWYDEAYYQNSLDRNPTGPTDGTSRVLRGGSWIDYPEGLRCAVRYWDYPSVGISYVGFRCVRDVR